MANSTEGLTASSLRLGVFCSKLIGLRFSKFSLQAEGFGCFGPQIRILMAKLLEKSGSHEYGEHLFYVLLNTPELNN